MTTPRERILRDGAAILGQMGAEALNIKVKITGAGSTVIFEGEVPTGTLDAEPTAPVDAPRHWKWLSATEAAIVAVAGDAYVPAEQLAGKAGLVKSSELMPILRNLVERNVLESAQGRGYRLAVAASGEEAPVSTYRTTEGEPS
jgi:hypothetical protein